jgi:uncharacterized protein (TIGR02757 family)
MSKIKSRKLKAVKSKSLPELKIWLDLVNDQVEVPEYIPKDPVSFMHAFDKKEDQLIAGFFAAIMAWGRRDIVLNKVNDLLQRMDYEPEKFIRNFSEDDMIQLEGFKHRTFTSGDIFWLIRAMQSILKVHGDFESFWKYCYTLAIKHSSHLMDEFHIEFFKFINDAPQRTKKHIANRKKNSSCKRLYLFLRWSIRKDSVVDLGLMNFMPISDLMIPLDVHVARQARKLGLLTRLQNDWGAVQELTDRLRLMNPHDPARYDYALFGIGVLGINLPKEFILNSQTDS